MEIYKTTKIYILIPARASTAGPEFLHQLGTYLREKLKFNTYIYCVPSKYSNPVPTQYLIYNNPIADKIEDEEENILISPEIFPLLKEMSRYKNIRKIVWWLSLDNYYYHKYLNEHKIRSLLFRIINKIYRSIKDNDFIELSKYARKKYLNFHLLNDVLLWDVKNNICSARHIEEILVKNNLHNVQYISELLNEEFLNNNWDISLKKNIVVYNPTKGIAFTKTLIKEARGINFVPIKKMSRNKVIELLKRAKVYVDFGNHPGRDRLPREAAILGCCIITNKKGGARLYEDLGIYENYKFNDKKKNIPLIIKKINECMINYNIVVNDFSNYRNSILEEPMRFSIGLKSFFKSA